MGEELIAPRARGPRLECVYARARRLTEEMSNYSANLCDVCPCAFALVLCVERNCKEFTRWIVNAGGGGGLNAISSPAQFRARVFFPYMLCVCVCVFGAGDLITSELELFAK